jgi:hypothetical protein
MSEVAAVTNEIVNQPPVNAEKTAIFTSVFDLTPAEKLQLVEDLWDDLAATPEAAPLHEWQSKSWIVAKPIS